MPVRNDDLTGVGKDEADCLGAREDILSGHGKPSQLSDFKSVLRSYWP